MDRRGERKKNEPDITKAKNERAIVNAYHFWFSFAVFKQNFHNSVAE